MKTFLSILLTVLIFAGLFFIFTNKILITCLVYAIFGFSMLIIIIIFYEEVIYPMIDNIVNDIKRKKK